MKLAFSLFLLAALVAGCSGHTHNIQTLSPLTGQEATWVSTPDSRLDVQVPEGWQIQDSHGEHALRLTNTTDAQHGVILIRALETQMPPSDHALKLVREGALAQLSWDMNSFELKSVRDLKVGACDAFEIRYRCSIDGTPSQGWFTVIRAQTGLYAFNTLASVADSKAAEGALNQLLGSLRRNSAPEPLVSR